MAMFHIKRTGHYWIIAFIVKAHAGPQDIMHDPTHERQARAAKLALVFLSCMKTGGAAAACALIKGYKWQLLITIVNVKKYLRAVDSIRHREKLLPLK